MGQFKLFVGCFYCDVADGSTTPVNKKNIKIAVFDIKILFKYKEMVDTKNISTKRNERILQFYIVFLNMSN